MQLFSDEYARVNGRKIVPIYTSIPVCYQCWRGTSMVCRRILTNYDCHYSDLLNKCATYVYDD